MSIVMIAVIGNNNELGKNNSLLWYLPLDLEFFKEKTMNKTIVMGKNTFNSLKKILLGRKYVVLTHSNVSVCDKIDVCHSIEEVLIRYKDIKEEVFIIGGGSIYCAFLPYASKLYLTEVDATYPEADVFFPEFDKKEWQMTIIDKFVDNGFKCKHIEYKRM